MTRSSVLLPHPFGPITTVRLPAGMSRLRPFSATSRSPAAGNETVTSDRRTGRASGIGAPFAWIVASTAMDYSRCAWHRARGSAAERAPARLPQARRRAPRVSRCVGERLAVAFSHPDCDRRPCLPSSVALAGSGRPRQVHPDRRSSASRPDGVRGLALSEPKAMIRSVGDSLRAACPTVNQPRRAWQAERSDRSMCSPRGVHRAVILSGGE